jgi:hypothetical protein
MDNNMAYELDFAALQTRLEAVQADLEHLSLQDYSTDDSTTTDTIMATPSEPSSPMDLTTPVSEDTDMSDESSDSALTYDSDTEMTPPTPGSTYSCTIPSFNDRSPEIRDARLANALLSLDEDIPSKFPRYRFPPRFISRAFSKFSQTKSLTFDFPSGS